MSLPTQPTATTICTEALKLLGKSTPTSAEITRATDYGLEMVKGDLMRMGTEWDFLRTIAWRPLTAYISRYQLPSDYRKPISLRMLDGTRRGTAQGGSTTTIQLASSDTGTSADTIGKNIVITTGTVWSDAITLQCASYNSSTKTATMDSTWTTPTASDTYLVVDNYYDVDLKNAYEWPLNNRPEVPERPFQAFHRPDSAEGDFVFNRSPDKVYVAEMEYFADLLKINLTADLYSRILRLLNGLFIQGVFVWALQDDTRHTAERARYERMLAETAALHLYPNNVSEFSVRLDY